VATHSRPDLFQCSNDHHIETGLAQHLLLGSGEEPNEIGIRLDLPSGQVIVSGTEATLVQRRGAVVNVKLREIFFLKDGG
jgi:hypothetical protein